MRGPDILNSCELAERGPVVLAFVAARSEACDRQVDVLDAPARRYPDVSFAAVAIRGDRDELRAHDPPPRLVAARSRCDRDGGVANAYAVAICPTVTFAYEGGKVEGTSLATDRRRRRCARRLEELRRGRVSEPPLVEGEVAPELARGVARAAARVDRRSSVVPGPSPPELRERLRLLSDRFRGPQAIALRRQPIPHAYRIFFRHIGLEPDEQRMPVEALALERMKHGGFRSRNLLDDAITIAVMETGVPVWALDAARGRRRAAAARGGEGEPLGAARRGPLPAGRLVVADDGRAAGRRSSAPSRRAPASRERTRAMVLFSVAVPGVPPIHVEEALWTVWDIVAAD